MLGLGYKAKTHGRQLNRKRFQAALRSAGCRLNGIRAFQRHSIKKRGFKSQVQQ